MVQSIPGELSLQETSVLTSASNNGGSVTISILVAELGFVRFLMMIPFESMMIDKFNQMFCFDYF